jgi:hypothetical protein
MKKLLFVFLFTLSFAVNSADAAHCANIGDLAAKIFQAKTSGTPRADVETAVKAGKLSEASKQNMLDMIADLYETDTGSLNAIQIQLIYATSCME